MVQFKFDGLFLVLIKYLVCTFLFLNMCIYIEEKKRHLIAAILEKSPASHRAESKDQAG